MYDQAASGKRIDDRFVLRDQISEGSVGSIWSAVQLPHNRPVALKLLRPEVAALPQLRRRFAREARAASRLYHPNIAAVVDYGVGDGDEMYIAMELLEGVEVHQLIEQGISTHKLFTLADQLLAGLAHAHARGVVHRDLKPANVMVVNGTTRGRLGEVKIVDFGIARLQNEPEVNDTAQGQVVGTPRYMSPEQAAGERPLGPKTDLYNVGLILYELISGQAPFGDRSGMEVMSSHVHEPVPPLVTRGGLQVPDALIGFVHRALRKQRRDRWSSAAEMRNIIRSIARDTEVAGGAVVEAGGVPADTGTVREQAVPPRDEARRQDPQLLVSARRRIPFVGRASQRRQLRGAVDQMRDGQGSIVVMHGEAGVGKTRLAMWLKEWAEEEGLVRGHIGSFTRGSAEGVQGLREVLDSMMGTRGMERQQLVERVDRRLRRWECEQDVDVDRLADFMRPAGLNGDERTGAEATEKLFATIADVIEKAAERRPRLIIFDDLHWAGREVGDFLNQLAVQLRHRDVPLMIIGTVRTEDLGDNPALQTRLESLQRYEGESVHRFDLRRLDAESGRRLVRYVLPVHEELADTIYARSGGNPLHLVILVRYLRREGLVQWDGSRWVPSDEKAVTEAVPPSLADLFRRRLDQVQRRHSSGERLERLLERAAVAGPRFSYEVLRGMVERENDAALQHFDDDFDRLLDEGILIESQGRRREWYAFSHGVVRDHFLDGISEEDQRRRLHRLAARAMEDVYGQQPDARAVEIARHFDAARDDEAALKWYLRAMRTALRSTTPRQAANAGQAALEVMDRLVGIDDGQLDEWEVSTFIERCDDAGVAPKTYAAVSVQLGDLHEVFGEYENAESFYRRIVRLVGAEPTQIEWMMHRLAECWLGLGHVAWQRGDFEAAEWAFQRVGELVEDRGRLEEVQSRALRGLARVAWHRGAYDRAQRLATKALQSAQRRGDRIGTAKAQWILGEVARMRGDEEEARNRFEASLEIYEQIDRLSGLARNVLSLAQVHRYQKNFERAEQLYQRALRHHQKLGNRRGVGQCFNGLGDIARFRSDFETARNHYDRALEIYEAIGARYDVAVVYTNRGLTAMRCDELEEARRFLESARRLVADEEYPYLQAGVEFNLALVEAMRGDDENSSEILEGVIELADQFDIPDLDYAQPLEELGRLRSREGRAAEAMELWQRARDIYEELALDEDRDRLNRLISSIND